MNPNGLWRPLPNRALLRFGTVRPRVQIPGPRPNSEFWGSHCRAAARSGLTPRLAGGLRNFYQAAMSAGQGGTAGSAHAELMQNILEVLTKG